MFNSGTRAQTKLWCLILGPRAQTKLRCLILGPRGVPKRETVGISPNRVLQIIELSGLWSARVAFYTMF